MFSTKLSRAAHRATTSHTAATAAITATSAPTPSTRPTTSHQRRPSSSKASCPPDNSAPKAAPTAKADGTESQAAPVSGRAIPSKSNKGRSRGGYRRVGQDVKSTVKAEVPVDQFAGLPSVPSVQGIDAKDLFLSAFFSLHRPISITASIPPPTTHEAFNTIFTTQRERQAAENPWENGNSAERRPEDVIYTLHQTMENLESGARGAEDEGVRWEVIHESPSNADGIKHLDGIAPGQKMKSLDELVAQFRPFKAPPPPQPFPDAPADAKASEMKAAAKTARGRPRQKTFTTTITVTESTDADGQKSYSATSSPIVRVSDPQSQPQSQRRAHQPFLTRMYRRRLAQSPRLASTTNAASRFIGLQRSLSARSELSYPQLPAAVSRREPSSARQGRIQRMYLISVKRQRKLKMKKHKYKKLMKRTRNLRRKLDRN